MWVGTEFPGDTNAALKDVQFRLYGEMLMRLYSRPRDRYLEACRLVQVETELTTRLPTMEHIDHRTLQDTHDLIAAWFRFSRNEGDQLRLGGTGDAYQERLAAEWRTFFDEEITRLTSSDEFTRAVLTAAAFGNTKGGDAAETLLRGFLEGRYYTMKAASVSARGLPSG